MHSCSIGLLHTRCALPPILLRNFVASTVMSAITDKHHFSSFFRQLGLFLVRHLFLFPPVGVGHRAVHRVVDFIFFSLSGCLQKARPPSTWSRWGSPSLIHHSSFSNYRPLRVRNRLHGATGLTIRRCSGKRMNWPFFKFSGHGVSREARCGIPISVAEGLDRGEGLWRWLNMSGGPLSGNADHGATLHEQSHQYHYEDNGKDTHT